MLNVPNKQNYPCTEGVPSGVLCVGIGQCLMLVGAMIRD